MFELTQCLAVSRRDEFIRMSPSKSIDGAPSSSRSARMRKGRSGYAAIDSDERGAVQHRCCESELDAANLSPCTRKPHMATALTALTDVELLRPTSRQRQSSSPPFPRERRLLCVMRASTCAQMGQ